MSTIHALSERIRRGEAIPSGLAAILHSLTPAVRAGMWLRLRGRRTRVAARVISFGNITAGGTGKTPAVIERAQAELAAGHRVAVLTRGYGSRKCEEPLLIAPDEAAAELAACLGDEAALIRRRVPGVYIVKAAKRVEGARAAIERGCDTLILDDGFQHVALERDENVLVIDAANPFGNGYLVPRGILREPISAMDRATHLLLTRCDQAKDLDGLTAQLEGCCPGRTIRRTRHAPHGLWRVATGESAPLEELRGIEVTALCGIGHPESFFRTLESLGAVIRDRIVFPDHGAIAPEALPRAGRIITTEKDAMRLSRAGDNVWALAIELRDMPG